MTGETKRLTATEAAVLGLLRHGEELSGYDLRKRVAGGVGYFWAPARSRIYAVLPRLVDSGLTTRRDVPQRGRPDKQVYRITAAGRAALRVWLQEPVDAGADRDVFLLKIFFGAAGDPGDVLAHVRRRRAEAQQLRADLEAMEARDAGTGDDPYPRLTRRYGLAFAASVERWADAAEVELVARTDAGSLTR